MEIALLAGKYVLVALIYVFVWQVYKGLIAQAREDREEATTRQARAETPRIIGPTPVPTPRRSAPTPVVAAPVPVAPLPPQRVASAESVREVPAEEAGEEKPHIPAFLAKELPPDLAAAEGLPSGAAAESVMEVLAEREAAPEPEPGTPLTPTPGPEPGTLVVSASTPRLVVLHSESPDLAPGREFPLLAAATIGRAGHNLVVLSDTFVSSQHALIFLKEGRRVLRDRGSTNGTLVNGHRVSGDHILHDGEQIMVGTTMLRYVEPG